MGSSNVEDDEITVLVTGFGPFKEQFPHNPSWEIAHRLPDYLPPLRAKSTGASSATTPLPPVRILVYPKPVRVNYQVVRGLVPQLWDPSAGLTAGRRIDYTLHVGMAGPRPFYALERVGHRDGYGMRDVDGKLLRDEERRLEEGAGWVWHGCPPALETELDAEDVMERWIKHSPDNLDLRMSFDAGHYLCDFIYYSSLAHLWKAQERRRVLFLHVPADASEDALRTGTELVTQLIRSIVESELSKKQPAATY
ncbi:Pyroglutamyl peptidase type [Pleurostoma richardsiae]|uniref:Pyroglutamyl peptidase type n=1 Tax=Pleurostoma richardsiae TaxID=41990 RepID=A0AA38RUI2_9PEZI|nr:Pyroglutamyl peptidase type [Pleurostoma richardsiae]